jgi:cytoskeletal protein CcmA (bactofilin family)
MGTSYTRNDTSNNIADGNIINATDLDGEFDAIQSAFATTGHTHDGTAAEGGPITVAGPTQDLVVSATNVNPKTTNTLDLGTSSLLYKDSYLQGVMYFRDTGLKVLSSTDGQLDIDADAELELTSPIVDINASTGLALDGANLNSAWTINTNNKIQFRDTGVYINSSADGQLDIVADTEIQIAATTIDINGAVDVSGEIIAASLDISGDADIDGTLEADAITIGGITLAETISDTVGAMVTSNTESGITVTYDDADNTLDFTVGTLNQDTTGSAATLTTPRAIAVAGDVTGTANFDGSAGISITTTLATDAIVTANITNANVTLDKMAANSVDSDQYVDGSIDLIHMSANSVDSDQYVDGSIDTAHLADDAVTGDKLANNIDIAGTLDVTGLLTADANVVVAGNLTVNGTTTTLNTATLDVEDKNITINYGAGDTSGSANGAGLTIQDAIDASNDATILWDTTNDEFDFSHPINVAGKVTSTGTSVFASLDISGDIDVDGTTNLDVVDIDGAVNMATTALVTGVLTTTATQVATGGITSGGDIISDTDSTDSLGSTTVRWLKGWFDTLTAGTMTIGGGTITDSSGAITFGNENLVTTGTLGSGALTATTIAGTTGDFSGNVAITKAGDITTSVFDTTTGVAASTRTLAEHYVQGKSNSGATVNFQNITYNSADATNGSEDGSQVHYQMLAGTTFAGDIALSPADNTPTLNFRHNSNADTYASIIVDTDAGTGGKMVIGTKRNGDSLLTALTLDDGQNATFAGSLTAQDTIIGAAITGATTSKLQVTQDSGVADWAGAFQADTTSGASYGLKVHGGTTAADSALFVRNAANSTTLFDVNGVTPPSRGRLVLMAHYTQTFMPQGQLYN